MIQMILRAAARAFGHKYSYDVGYMTHVIDHSTRAGLGLTLLPLASHYKGPKPARQVWAGALLASTLDGDCGPCGQLVVQFALQDGVSGDLLRACVEGRLQDGGDVALGFRFAQRAMSPSYGQNDYGDEIRRRFGEQALIAASFAAATGRIHPVLERGLGTGHACQQIEIEGRMAIRAGTS